MAIGLAAVIGALLPVPPLAAIDDPTGRLVAILLASMFPLLTALGIRRAVRTRLRRIQVWGPVALAAVSVAAMIVAYRWSPDVTAMTPWLQLAAIIGGGAIAWWLVPRHGALVGVASGVVYAFPIGMMIPALIAFAAPVAALVLLIVNLRRRRVARAAGVR